MRPFGQDFKFAQMLGMQLVERGDGFCHMAIDIDADTHFNPNGVAHGGVAYSLADSAMGGALLSQLDDGLICATIDLKINYHIAVRAGLLLCKATLLHRGKRVGNVDARLFQHDRLVASANGNFAIFPTPARKAAAE